MFVGNNRTNGVLFPGATELTGDPRLIVVAETKLGDFD